MSNHEKPRTLTLRDRLDLDAMWEGAFVEGWPAPASAVHFVRATPGTHHYEPAPLTMLSAWADDVRQAGGSVEVDPSLRTPYAYRTGLLSALLDTPIPTNPIRHHASPIRVVEETAKKRAFSHLADGIDVESVGELAAFSKTLSEALNNVFEHAETPLGCVVSASRFDGADRVTLAVADRGCTIPGHIRRRHGHDLSDAAALRRAVEPGVTGTAAPGAKRKARVTSTNAGLGLFVMRQIAALTTGRFAVVSGTAGLFGNGDTVHDIDVLAPWAGTVVCVSYLGRDSDRAVEAVTEAITTGMADDRKRQPFSFDPLAGDGLRIPVTPTFRGLIEDKAFDVIEVDVPLAVQVQQTSRRGNQHIHSSA